MWAQLRPNQCVGWIWVEIFNLTQKLGRARAKFFDTKSDPTLPENRVSPNLNLTRARAKKSSLMVGSDRFRPEEKTTAYFLPYPNMVYMIRSTLTTCQALQS